MPVATNALVTLTEAQAFLGSSAIDDALVESAINRASELIEAYCDRPLKRTAALGPASLRFSGFSGRYLRIGAEPIDTALTVTVTVDGIAQSVWRKDADGDPHDADVAVGYLSDGVFHPGRPERALFRPNVLYRASSWCAGKVGGIAVSYHGALATIPDDLKGAALLMIRKIIDGQKKNMGEVITVNTPSGGVTLFDRWMPLETRDILDSRYRRWGI